MHGLLVDYDSPISGELLAKCREEPAAEFLPAYAVETFSGRGRLYWAFERPVVLSTQAQVKAFLMIVSKKLKLNSWLAGFDTEATGSIQQYYEIGRQWVPMSPDSKIPGASLDLWLWDASRALKLSPDDEPEYGIPMDRIADEVAERYPGRWKGPFEIGRRGVTFWVPEADNESAAIVMNHGVMSFTHGFNSWRQLFGQEFVDQFQADKVSKVVDRLAFDGKEYWLRTDQGTWEAWNRENIALYMRGCGLNPKKGGGAFMSEIDKGLLDTIQLRRVNRAMPFVNWQSGIFTYEGKRFLNIATSKRADPAPSYEAGRMTFPDGRQHFPFIYELLSKMFDSEASDQLTFLLAWVKYAYENCYRWHPQPGQVIVLAGPVNKGKTLFVTGVLSKLLGGHADASNHMVFGDRWTEDLLSAAVLRIEDEQSETSNNTKRAFSARLKKYVANATMTFDAKYKQTGQVPFFGRTVITCNLDAESLRILPSLDISNHDKISFFKANETRMKFPDRATIEAALTHEIPYFARFLLDWTYPAHVVAEEKRFGVAPYHHNDLVTESHVQGNVGSFLEILIPFLRAWRDGHPGVNEYVGTASELYEDMTAFKPAVMAAIRSPQLIGTCLGLLQSNQYRLRNVMANRIRKWIIQIEVNPLPIATPAASVLLDAEAIPVQQQEEDAPLAALRESVSS